LTPAEKKKALDIWEQDARQLITASNEGMAAPKEGLRRDHAPNSPVTKWGFDHAACWETLMINTSISPSDAATSTTVIALAA